MTDIGISCRKDRYWRGVGTQPLCRDDEEKAGLLCYPKCDAGFEGKGPVCWENCPAGTTACGANCIGEGENCALYILGTVNDSLQSVR